MRMAIDPKKPVLPLEFPEFMDIKLTNKCLGGCSWCYQDSKQDAGHAENAVEKINTFFGAMPMSHRPIQVAIGGGEPTLHPEFIDVLLAFDALGITPNYTTNGMSISEEILNVTKEVCGGIAISAHAHLRSLWAESVFLVHEKKIPLSLHHIISDEASVDTFLKEMDTWNDKVKYHVLLPLVGMGRASSGITASDYLFEKLEEIPDENLSKVAFGALFYKDLLKRKHSLPVSLYGPEDFSRFLDLITMKCYVSSFDLTEHPIPMSKLKWIKFSQRIRKFFGIGQKMQNKLAEAV